jgi:DNA-binding XRE family transcriptional regulator
LGEVRRLVINTGLTVAAKNRVTQARMAEALSKADLARKSGLSDRTVHRVENGRRTISPTTKSKIVKALNSLPDKQRDYTIEYLFPEE